MASKTATQATTELPTPKPGDVCPCCNRKVPVNSKAAMTPDEQKARRLEYNNRPEVIAKRKEYNAKRNAEIKELRELRAMLDAQEAAEGDDTDTDTDESDDE